MVMVVMLIMMMVMAIMMVIMVRVMEVKDCVVGARLSVEDSEHHRHHPGDDEAGGEQRQQRGGELRGEPDQRQSGPREETPRGDWRGEGVHLQVSQLVVQSPAIIIISKRSEIIVTLSQGC